MEIKYRNYVLVGNESWYVYNIIIANDEPDIRIAITLSYWKINKYVSLQLSWTKMAMEHWHIIRM